MEAENFCEPPKVDARERMGEEGEIASGKERTESRREYISRLSAGPRGKGHLRTSEAFLIFKSKRTEESGGARKKVAKFYRKVLWELFSLGVSQTASLRTEYFIHDC